MTRKEKVFKASKTSSIKISLEDVKKGSNIGFDAETISDITNIDRINVSRELNGLVREGRVFKVIDRPVMFLVEESLKEIIPISYDDLVFDKVDDFLKR